MSTIFHDKIRSSFTISNRFSFFSNNRAHRFGLRWERNDFNYMLVEIFSNLSVVISKFMSKLKESTIGFIANLINFISFKDWICTWIKANSNWKSLGNLFINVWFVWIFKGIFKNKDTSNGHLVHCKGSSFVGTNVISSSHSFTSL